MSDFRIDVGYQEGFYKSAGPINTWYIPTWIYLSNADKKKFISERYNQGVKIGGSKEIKTGKYPNNIKTLKI